MRATHVIGQNFQARDRVRTCLFAQHQIAISLIAVGLLGARRNINHALPHGPAAVAQRTFEQQIAGGVLGVVVLLCIVIHMPHPKLL